MPLREPLEIERSLLEIPEACSTEMVLESHRAVGSRISGYEGSALVFNVLLRGGAIVGVSSGFERLTQRSCKEVLGRSWRVQLSGLADSLVAGSASQDIDSFLRMARLRHIDAMADCTIVFVNSRADGSTFTCHSTMRMVKVPCPQREGVHVPYVVAVQRDLDALGGVERHRAAEEDCGHLDGLSDLLGAEAAPKAPPPGASFFPSPLSFKCILLRNVSAGMRREPHQVPRGCVLMSASSVALRNGGASFEVVVERTLPSWVSRLPFLGFTCTPSKSVQGDRCFFGPLPHAFCLGESVTIGGSGEAWMHLEGKPLEPAIGQRMEDSAMHQHLTPDLPEHRRRAPVKLQAGDVLKCCYEELEPEGGDLGTDRSAAIRSRISLRVNHASAFQFEFDTSLPKKPLYAVVDVCYSVYQVSMHNTEDSAAAGG
mmetsp:Transcript_53391/g.159363  ORF Transcript_53391/g.159363 Transcript_53391/m.159363 type:complete len:428 (+) Transcript_53391:119-1402(+)